MDTVALADSNKNIPKESPIAADPALKKQRIDEKPAVAEPTPLVDDDRDAVVVVTVEAKATPAPAQPVEKLLVKKLTDKAILPKRGSAFAAGYDLASAEDVVVPARGKALVKTDLAIRVPPGTYGRVAPRSGLASKNFIDTGAGVVDEDYRGNVGVLLFNHADADFQVKAGDRVAQLVLERIATPDVEEVSELDDTERGVKGYGSTGVAAK